MIYSFTHSLQACTMLLLPVFGASVSPPTRAEIKTLPGWSGELPSRMSNGWIDAGTPPNGNGQMYFHYWFVESESNPATDPVVLWYNGGPGASSLFGLLVELGPLMLNSESLAGAVYNKTGVPQLIYNPYSWSKTANILIVDNPPPVGFSFCTPAGQTGSGTSCGPWNDELVAAANHEFLVGWMHAYPEFSRNQVFITGESYAGIYVPTIARSVLKDPRGINLAGFAVGDGCMGNEVLCGEANGPWYNIEFMHGHGQFSNSLYKEIMEKCPEAALRSGDLSEVCKALITRMDKEIGGYYGYNLYDACPHDGPFLRDITRPRRTWGLPASSLTIIGGALNDYACPGDVLNMWLNRSDVRSALHVPGQANFFSGDNGVGFNYTLTEPNLLPFYAHCAENTTLRPGDQFVCDAGQVHGLLPSRGPEANARVASVDSGRCFQCWWIRHVLRGRLRVPDNSRQRPHGS
eukprot:m.419853 g.419853  ORF g.419853 m.419853 type:complete len:463 (-) comp21310_c0_seq1:1157-2545(-)